MPAQSVAFARSIDEKIIVKASGRDGWIAAMSVDANGQQYLVQTTEANGRPQQLWLRAFEMQDAAG